MMLLYTVNSCCLTALCFQVVSIIESRARAVDLMTHNYYELLYAFHTNRHNFRKGRRFITIIMTLY